MQEDDSDMKQVPVLKEYVREMIVSPVGNNILFKLNIINSVQRLGVSYHFEHEIDEALHQIYEISTKDNNIISYNDDLHHLALLFRLLRQQGYPISSGMTLPLLHQINISHLIIYSLFVPYDELISVQKSHIVRNDKNISAYMYLWIKSA